MVEPTGYDDYLRAIGFRESYKVMAYYTRPLYIHHGLSFSN